jgi:hypothetical protein
MWKGNPKKKKRKRFLEALFISNIHFSFFGGTGI